jgi:uncharacterized phage infection (PIP) family protein YhgE
MAIPPRNFNTERIEAESRATVQVTRSDVASVRRSMQDINQQIDNRRSRIDDVLRNNRSLSSEQIIDLLDNRENLNQLHTQASNLERQLVADMPQVPSNAALSTRERQEIQGLYRSGLYTQRQLADQYGVSQPAISQCTRNDDD